MPRPPISTSGSTTWIESLAARPLLNAKIISVDANQPMKNGQSSVAAAGPAPGASVRSDGRGMTTATTAKMIASSS